MTVYYVSAPALGMVKIGFAADHWQRFSKLQSDSPCELIMLATEDGDETLEAARHAQFAAHRDRREWFHLSPEIAAHIATLAPAERVSKAGSKGVVALARDTGISTSYASQILSGKRPPSLKMALSIFSKTGQRFGKLTKASDADIAVLQSVYGIAA